MLTPLSEILAVAVAKRRAVGAFTCYDLLGATAVLAAAEERRTGVVLLVGARSAQGPEGHALLAGMVAAAAASSVEVCVQLDHSADPDLAEAAFALGAGAVTVDAADRPPDEALALVRDVMGRARAAGAEVEVELDRIEGDEDAACETTPQAMSDPSEAARFLEQSGASALAVSIGNVHGRYHSAPHLDWERLAALRARLDVPLVLHGASGLGDEVVRRAVRSGIAKVNVNTELRTRYVQVLREELPRAMEGADLLGVHRALRVALTEEVHRKLHVLTSEADS